MPCVRGNRRPLRAGAGRRVAQSYRLSAGLDAALGEAAARCGRAGSRERVKHFARVGASPRPPPRAALAATSIRSERDAGVPTT
ncbi:hypothetical protein EVAR_42684_1 [Eumeta japonica]|uniref:Uncharacterized protein n=1 Tax=Eumeta variegata TaxID=151549 RepID=A0A4C1X0L9_EUMVA|nr:hypothetical protein EVAR_42684_1 [Eumeta japonica]